MPGTSRASKGNICYHVINRGNGGARVFRKQEDYLRFTEMLGQACSRLPLRVVSWCLMPNHFHLLLWPYADGYLSSWMHWLMTCKENKVACPLFVPADDNRDSLLTYGYDFLSEYAS